MAERLVKNFERMVITAERLKKISNGRPERLNGTSKISVICRRVTFGQVAEILQ